MSRSGYSPALAYAREVGDDVEFEVVSSIPELDYAEDESAHYDARFTTAFTIDDAPEWARFEGILGVEPDTLAEIKAANLTQSNGDRTTSGRWLLKGRDNGQHAYILANNGVYLLTVYEETQDGREIRGLAVISARDLDALLRGHWYDVDRCEGTHARLGWPHILDDSEVSP